MKRGRFAPQRSIARIVIEVSAGALCLLLVVTAVLGVSEGLLAVAVLSSVSALVNGYLLVRLLRTRVRSDERLEAQREAFVMKLEDRLAALRTRRK